MYLRTQQPPQPNNLKTAKSENTCTMKQKISLCCMSSLSQTMANSKGPPSVACTSHTDPLIRQGVCLLQRHGLHNTRHIGRLPKNERFNIATSSAALRSRLAASSATTLRAPSDNDSRCGSDRLFTLVSQFSTTLGRAALWCKYSDILVQNKYAYTQQ